MCSVLSANRPVREFGTKFRDILTGSRVEADGRVHVYIKARMFYFAYLTRLFLSTPQIHIELCPQTFYLDSQVFDFIVQLTTPLLITASTNCYFSPVILSSSAKVAYSSSESSSRKALKFLSADRKLVPVIARIRTEAENVLILPSK